MKKPVITLRLHDAEVTIDGHKVKIQLPKGCTGILFCFESKKTAREWWGKDVKMQEVEVLGL